jgi:S1-C subfamily serine protease
VGVVPALDGAGRVERAVLELQAAVRSGDSGGPFVLADGRLAGIVFGRSLSEEGVGFAIPVSTVLDAVATAGSSAQAVDTGTCLAG